MRKIIFALAVLMIAAPAWARIDVTCEQMGEDSCDVLVSYDSRTEVNLPRAFALDIIVHGCNVVAVECISSDYYIHLGTMDIDSQGVVTNWGTCVGEVEDHEDTLPGLDSNGVTLEMTSLYEEEDPAPANEGELVVLTLDGECSGAITVEIKENTIRGGGKAVVMENAYEVVEVNVPSSCEVLRGPACTRGAHFFDGDVGGAPWVNEGAPDNCIDTYDLNFMVVNWNKTPGTGLDPCADCGCAPWIDGGNSPDGVCDTYDLNKIVVNWGTCW